MARKILFLLLCALLSFSCREQVNFSSEQDTKLTADEAAIQDAFGQMVARDNLPMDSLTGYFQRLDSLDTAKPAFLALKEVCKASYYKRKASNSLAISHFNHALQTLADNDTIAALSYAGLGNIYKDMGDYTEALKNFQSALTIYEEQDRRIEVAHMYKHIGALYMSWQRFDESLDYYDRAEKIALRFGDSLLYADCNNNIGTVLEQQNKLDDAIVRYTSALNIYEKHGITGGVSMSYSNLAIVYKLKKNYNKSVEYNLKSLDLSEKTNDKWMQAATLNNIAFLYYEIKNYVLASEYSRRSLTLATAIDAPEIIYNTYENMANTAFATQKYTDAFAYQKLFMETKDRFNNAEVNHTLSELNIKYETEKKEKALTETQLQLSEEALASKQKNTWLIVFGGFIIIAVVVAINLRTRARLTQRKLQLENQLIQEQAQSQIQQQRLEISRDLHDSLGSQLTFINTVLDSIKSSASKLDEKISSKINTLSDFSENSVSELKSVLWVLNTNEIHLQDLKSKLLNLIKNAGEATENLRFHFAFDAQDNFQLNSKQAINLFRVSQEIINNTVKHAKATDIRIRVEQSDKSLLLQISDNGIGFDLEKEKTKSFGLSNIQNRISEIGGQVQIRTAENKGTSYDIQAPLKP